MAPLKFMSQKITDFLSSVGMMIIGVGLLFFSSVTLTAKPVQNFVSNLSEPGLRLFTGGDYKVPSLPVSRPLLPMLRDKNLMYSATMTAKTVMVVDDQTNTVLFKKNANEVRSLASMSKLMSVLVLNELITNWASSTVITDEDADPSSHHLFVGERYTLQDLWKVALIGSSNSAIHALVRSTGLSEEEFAAKMNEKAKELSLNSLRFVEPTGLDSRNMGKAVDILKLLKMALKVDRIAAALRLPEFYAMPINEKKRHQVWNTDWLLTNWVPNTFDKEILVGKTGFIDESGYNFVVRVPGKKPHIIRVVILGAASNEARFTETKELSEWIFANFVWPEDEEYHRLAATR